LGSPDEARAMVLERPQAILEGRPVNLPEPRPPKKRKWWMRW